MSEQLPTSNSDTKLSGDEVSSQQESSKYPVITEPYFPVETSALPVQKVNYVLERFGWYESILLEIWTDKSVTPLQALAKASFFIRSMFRPFT